MTDMKAKFSPIEKTANILFMLISAVLLIVQQFSIIELHEGDPTLPELKNENIIDISGEEIKILKWNLLIEISVRG